MTLSPLTIADTNVYVTATSLIADHGEYACVEAAARADASQRIGNVVEFSHWRQVERAVQILQLEDIIGDLH